MPWTCPGRANKPWRCMGWVESRWTPTRAAACVKGGTAHGATDDIGLASVENKVSVPDWHATILHLLGLHHEKLFYEQHGLKEKLTSVFEAHVVKEILA